MEGDVPSDDYRCAKMTYKEIWLMHPEYSEQGGWDKFPSRVRILRKQIKRDQSRAANDLAAFEDFKKKHKAATHTHAGYPQWAFSDAEELLKKDIDEGKHVGLQKKELWESRNEYKAFPLKVFRDHVYQTIKTRKYYNFLEVKGKKNMRRGGA